MVPVTHKIVELGVVSIYHCIETVFGDDTFKRGDIEQEYQRSKDRPLRNTTRQISWWRKNLIESNALRTIFKVLTLLLDDWMIVLRQFGETWSNWLREVKHDTLFSHTFRPRARVRARLISMISDSKTLSSQNSQPSVQESHVSVELEKTLRWTYRQRAWKAASY